MRLGVTSWSFPQCTLDEVVGIAKTLGLDAIDVGFFYRSSLDRREVVSDPERSAARVRALGLDVSNLYYLFGTSPDVRSLTDRAHAEENVRDFRSVAEFCERAGIRSVMLLPGVWHPGQTSRDTLRTSSETLSKIVDIALEHDVVPTVEPHVHSAFESPAAAKELLDRVPGLRVVLDYAHFVCLGHTQEEIDVLAGYAGHVHLRQARPGALQSKLDEGTINFRRVLAKLDEVGYDGDLSIEYVHQAYMNTLYDDVLTETIRMRDLVRSQA